MAEKHMDVPVFGRIPDAVRITGLSRRGVYRMREEGLIEFRKVGSSTLVPIRELLAVIENLPAR